MKTASMYEFLFYAPALFVICLLGGCCCTTQPHGDPASLPGSRRTGHTPVEWNAEWQCTFDDPETLSNMPVMTGEWVIKDGQLWAVGGKSERVILFQPGRPGPVRVEFDVTSYANEKGRIGDITVLLNTLKQPTERTKWFRGNNREGYLLTTGSYGNNCSAFYRKGKPIARTEYSPIVSGKHNHVCLEFNNGHIRYWMNDEIVLEAWDSSPVKLRSDLWIGIRTFATLMAVDNVIISGTKPDSGQEK